MRTISVWFVALSTCGCSDFGFRDAVLWRVAAPDGELVAVCQEVAQFDGPGYEVRLERPDGSMVRHLYSIGDGDPCTEVVWSPDGRMLAVLSGHVARVRFVDIAGALENPGTPTADWSWRQVGLSGGEGSALRFIDSRTVELQVVPMRAGNASPAGRGPATLRRFEVPLPLVTGH